MKRLKDWLKEMFGDPFATLLLVVILLVLAVSVIPKCASAEENTYTWTLPTHNEDGTPYTNPQDINFWKKVADLPHTQTSITVEEQPGVHEYTVTARNTDDEYSVIAVPAGRTTTSYVALAGVTVYQVVSITNGFWLIPIGTLATQGNCVIGQEVNGYNVVMNADVAWLPGSTARPVMVVADCV